MVKKETLSDAQITLASPEGRGTNPLPMAPSAPHKHLLHLGDCTLTTLHNIGFSGNLITDIDYLPSLELLQRLHRAGIAVRRKGSHPRPSLTNRAVVSGIWIKAAAGARRNGAKDWTDEICS